jgi:DNA-binding XRE family transcriptional regulator
MNTTKRKRLEAAGWKVGTAGQLLDLSDQEAALVELKLALTDKLKQQRQKSRITQTELAKLLRSSQSRVAKIEAGDRSISLDLLLRAVFATGTTVREVGSYLTRVGNGRSRRHAVATR